MENTPTLQTERLLLRRFNEHDAEAVYSILSDTEVNTFLPMFPLESIEAAAQYIQTHCLQSYEKQGSYCYAICRKSDGVLIGEVHVSEDESHDFGYWLRKDCWHQGFITEACRVVVDLLKASGMEYITATHDVNNPRSGAVMKKIGMTYQYTYEELCHPKEILVHFRMYQLNFDGQKDRVFRKYWERFPVHFIEENI